MGSQSTATGGFGRRPFADTLRSEAEQICQNQAPRKGIGKPHHQRIEMEPGNCC
jgi:hypothetical protein